MIGTTLNHYRILGKLGAGGMGEVFQAEDTKLGRKVALKVLPTSMAGDPERRERFEREARAIAALNHPNIVTIYSVEEADGTPFLTMELVEGQTLGDAIPAHGLPISRVLAIGTAIADAIAAAQQRGITHRDLKPANVMVTPSGQAKILDFGLAKLRESEPGTEEGVTTLADTGLTGEGRIVGTVAYMSPEQAEGKPVDSRSDIFSLGVILHQMSVGEQPFKGDTPVSVISAIVKDTPISVTEIRPALPVDLARIIKKCLTKTPERRYQSAIDLRNDLEELKAGLDSGEVQASGIRQAPAREGQRPLLMGIAAMAMLAVAAIVWFATRSNEPEASAISLADMRISRLTSSGNASLAAISPDGRYVVHVVREGGQQSLWIRQTATTSNVEIVPPADVRYDGVTISPDATYVYYSAYEGSQAVSALYQVPALGGTPRKIIEDIDTPVSFSPDGSEFVFVRGIINPRGANLVVAKADGSGERVLAASGANDMFVLERPSWSSDGTRIAVGYLALQSGGYAGVRTIDVASGTASALGDPIWSGMSDVAWLADGSAVVVTAVEKAGSTQQIWRIDYPGGRATRVTNDLSTYRGVTLSADSRALATVRAETMADLWVLPVGDATAARQITSAGSSGYDGVTGTAWTPDGRIIYGSGASGNPDIWIANADGSGRQQLTVDPAADGQPVLCGDGRFIVFVSMRTGVPHIWRMALDGSNPVQLSAGPLSFGPQCGPNSNSVVYTSATTEGKIALWRVPIDGGEPVLARDFQMAGNAISPDGTMVAGAYVEGQLQGIGVLSLDSNEPPMVLPVFPRAMAWSPDGKALTYVDVRNGVDNIWRQPLPSGTPTQLTTFTSDSIYTFAWSHDGKQLVLSRGSTSTDVVLFSANDVAKDTP